MIDEATTERASLYVLGLLEDAEAARFAAAIRTNAELAELVEDLQRTTVALAASVPQHTPPAALKQRIMGRIRGEQPAPAARSRALEYLGWAAALALLCASTALYRDRARLQSANAAFVLRDNLSGVEIVRLRSQLAQSPSAGAVAVWDSQRQQGVLDISGLPPARADQDYQLWLIDPAYPNPVNGGVVRALAQARGRQPFAPAKPVHGVTKLAVSLERHGGVEKAEGPIVLISQ